MIDSDGSDDDDDDGDDNEDEDGDDGDVVDVVNDDDEKDLINLLPLLKEGLDQTEVSGPGCFTQPPLWTRHLGKMVMMIMVVLIMVIVVVMIPPLFLTIMLADFSKGLLKGCTHICHNKIGQNSG